MNDDHKVETAKADGTLSTSTPRSPQHKDESNVEPPQQQQETYNNNNNSSLSSHRPNKKKNPPKNKNRKKPAYRPVYLDFIQQEIDDLKREARHTYEIQARQNLEGELDDDDEKTITEKRMATSSMIDKLEELKTKLDTPDMLQRAGHDYSNYHHRISNKPEKTDSPKEEDATSTTTTTTTTTDANADAAATNTDAVDHFQQETLTLLHFFYIVRLAQKGFFTLISQNYPQVEPNALIHLCDKLVGGSLFVVKDPKENIRSTKRNQVFDLLRKLHHGVPESIGDGFVTTFEQVRHLIYDFIGSTTTTTTDFDNTTTLIPPSSSIQQQPPVWIVVPFDGMVDKSQQARPSLSDSTRQRKLTDGALRKDKRRPSLTPAITDKPAIVANANIPSATHDIESNAQLNGLITPDVVEEQQQQPEHEEATTTKDTLDDNDDRADFEKNKATLNNTSNAAVDTIAADTNTIDTTSTTKETLATTTDESTLLPDTTDTDIVATTDTTTNNNKETNVDIEAAAAAAVSADDDGWGPAPTSDSTSSSATASSAWTQGLLPEKQQQPAPAVGAAAPATMEEKGSENDVEDYSNDSNEGWGSPIANNKDSAPVWEGKLPDDVVTPGDETISGDLSDSKWQPVSDYDLQRRTMGGGGRGRGSGYRGGSGSGFGQGGRGYRSYGDGGGGRGGNTGGIRRGPGGSANAGWTKTRSTRPE